MEASFIWQLVYLISQVRVQILKLFDLFLVIYQNILNISITFLQLLNVDVDNLIQKIENLFWVI